MRILFFFLLITTVPVFAQKADIIKFEQLQKRIEQSPANVQVINFWATWCAPCIAELPLLEKLNGDRSADVKVLLVSLDFADKIEKVNAFVARKKLKAEVVLLDEIDYDLWINKVDAAWNGSIPATLVINYETGKRKIIERQLKDGELEALIKEISLKNP